MKSFGLSETKLFYFHWIFKKKEIKSAHPHAPLYTYEPPFQKSWIRHCCACSMLARDVDLLACMQQCACLSGGARSIFVWASVDRFSLCALGQNNGSEVCASSECPDYCVFAHARLSCRCSHISWHACITNSSGEFVISFEH